MSKNRFSGQRIKGRPGTIFRLALGLLLALTASAFDPPVAEDTPSGTCTPDDGPFRGYTFLSPEILSKSEVFAPYFLKWEDYYDRYYFNLDLQKEENLKEWQERFWQYRSAN